ncbi:MAG: BlaR1 family beta-lactam sensor/signal transducer [Deltaproteobacteria bacterium]|nr:BlaR1 family beta-lactam sensor/signal transducer [Deltaproteobacteria bacterium]
MIIAIRLILKDRIGANWQYIMWFLLIFKLLIFHGPESSFSMFNIFDHLSIQTLAGNYFETRGNENSGQNTEKKSLVTKRTNLTDDFSLSVNRTFLGSCDVVVFGVWLIGVITLIVYTINWIIKLKGTIKKSRKVNDEGAIRLLEECKIAVNINSHPTLIESRLIRSPMVVGAFRPYIILPTGIIDNLKKSELRFILLHELAHLKRRDLYINWITSFLQILHWFNPFIWYAFYQMRQDRESACDAYVLSILKPDEYKSYGAAIISFLERYSYSAYDYTIAGLASGRTNIKKRMAMIASYKNVTASGFIWRISLFLLMGCLVLTNAKGTSGANQAEKSSKPNKNIAYEDLSSYFQGYDGTFVLLDMKKNHYQVYNDENSHKRVSPDSTYKIISALVGLETGVLTDENTRFEWDGVIYPIEHWNRDQTLTSAIAYSVNWYFQKVDSIVGKIGIENYLKQIRYGNCDLSGDIDDFWVESSLRISPREQVEILKKLYTYDMPFSKRNIDAVKRVIKISEQDKVILSGKTGTGIVNGKSINGWFAGYVENENKVYIFATNIQGKERTDGTNARNITLSILKDKNIL